MKKLYRCAIPFKKIEDHGMLHEEAEDTKGLFRIPKSNKYIQHNDWKEKDKQQIYKILHS
jgi:hypothetical protein